MKGASLKEIRASGTRKAAERVIGAMQRGEVLFWHHGRSRSFAILGNREISPKVMACLLWGGIIRPRADALLPGDSQTFDLADQ